jgi:CBS domain-containing protein
VIGAVAEPTVTVVVAFVSVLRCLWGETNENPFTAVVVCGRMSSSDRVTVEDVMSSPLETISKDATVKEATERMRELDINALVVPTTPRAILSSTDVLDAVADGRNVADLQVTDVMTTDVETVSPDLYMEEVAAMMTTYGIKHLPVVDDDYVGMVSSTDVAAYLS